MTAIKITEAAIELGIKKGQAITLADKGILHYVSSGRNGKAKTVTLDSVWAAKKEPKEKLLEKLAVEKREALKTASVASEEPRTDERTVRQARCGEAILGVLEDILKELRQVKGILCRTDMKPVQEELGV